MSYKAALNRREMDSINYEVATNADRFDKRQFNSIFKASGNLQQIEKEQSSNIPTVHEFLTDVWSGLYKMNPEIREDVSPELTTNKMLMEHLLNNEDFQGYRDYTRLDELGSVIGATKYSYQALEWLQEEMKQNEGLQDAMNQLQQAIEQAQQQGGSDPSSNSNGQDQQQGEGQGNSGQSNQGQGNQPSSSSTQQAQQALEQALQDALNENGDTLNRALKKANSEAKEDNEAMKNLMGGSPGNQDGDLKKIPLAERITLAELLAKSKKMKRIAEWAGRFKAIARQKQKTKSNANTAKGGIEFGNEIENLLPTELLLFSQAKTKLDFLRRFSEEQTLQYEKKGKQSEGKGAIVACLDQSSSMSELDEMSKGFILALMMIAKKQRRDFAYIPFDTRCGRIRTFLKGKISTAEIVEIAQEFLGGGTNFSYPLRAAQEIMEKGAFKKGDIIFITDGAAQLSKDFKDSFIESKKKKEFSLMTIVIGSETLFKKVEAGYLGEMSDSIIQGESFTNEAVVDKALAI